MRIEAITDEELAALESENDVAPAQFRFADTIRELVPQSAELISDSQDEYDFVEREKRQDEVQDFLLDFDTKADPEIKGWVTEMQGMDSEKDWKTYIQTNALIGYHAGADGLDDEITRNLKRDLVAKEQFNGVGIGDDAAFHAEAVKHFTKRKDRRELDSMIVQQSSEFTLGQTLQDTAADWKTFREQIKSHAAYDPAQEAKYLERWEQVSQRQQEQVAAVMEYVAPALDAMEQVKNSGQSVYNVEKVADALLSTPEDQQDLALALLMKKAEQVGDKKEKGGHMTQLFARALANQMLVGPSITMEARALLDAEKLLSELQPGQEYGGRFGSLENYAKGRSATSSEGRIFGAILEPLMKNNVVTAEGLQQARESIKAQQGRLALVQKLQQVAAGSYDPLKSNGSFLAEKIAYPFIESALPSVASVLITKNVTGSGFGAAFTMWGSMASSNAAQLTAQNPNMSFSQAYEIGQHAATYQAALEYAETALTLGSTRLLGNALRTAQAPLWKTALKAGVVNFTAENITEGLQDLIPGIVQDLTADAPDTDWNKVMDGYWTQRADTFFALLPTIIMAGGGAAMQSKATRPELERIVAMTSKDSLLHASGITEEWRDKITAETDVVKRLNLFQEAIGKADQQTAQEGIARVETEAQEGRELIEQAQALGMQPYFRVNSDQTITVLDSTTNDEIATVQNSAEAGRIALSQMKVQEDKHAQTVAQMGGFLETMQAQVNTGKETGRAVNYEWRPFEKRTAKEQVESNPETAARTFAQLGIVEGMEHGAKLENSFINGFSRTTFEDDIYTTTNTILGSGDILTTFHEDTHGMRRQAMRDGRFTRDEQITALRSIDSALSRMGGRNAPRLFLGDAATDNDVTDTMLDEAISELMESEVLRVGKLGGKANTAANSRAYGEASNAIDAAYASSPLAAKAVSKLRGMIRYLRAKYGEVFNRAISVQRAIAKGEINEGEYLAFLDKLSGREDVATAEQQAVITATEIIDGVERVTFEDGSEMDMPFSLKSRISHKDTIDSLQKLVDEITTDPLRKRAVLEKARDHLQKLRRDTERNVRAFGKDMKTKVLDDERTRKNIQREANMRQALRRDELELESLDRYQGMIEQPELTKLQSQPIHSVLSDPKSPLKGRIRSRGATAKMQGDMLENVQLSDYNGADGLNPTIFGGTMSPDQMAQELFTLGLIRDESIDTMWDAIRKEQDSIAGMKELMRKAKADFRAARVTARDEAKAWQAAELKKQKLDHSLHAKLIRGAGMLDGILYALPPELRGKVGVHIATFTKITSDEKRLDYLSNAVEKVGDVMEKHLRKEYDRDLKKILERSKPAKDEVGKKRVGKAGADVHSLFDVLREAVKWNETETNGKIADIDAELNDTAKQPTAEREAWLLQLRELVQQIGDWRNADAARREAAVKNADRALMGGLAEYQSKKIKERERRDASREALAKDTGKAGSQEARENRLAKDAGVKGKLADTGIELLSFEQVVHGAFGEKSEEGARIVQVLRAAEDTKFDATQSRLDRLSDFMERLAGGKLKAEKLAWDMEQKSVKVKGMELSQSQLVTFALMWRQEDGKRHMRGEMDESGNPVGQWHYNESHAEAVEKAMTPEAAALLDFLIDEYAGEFEPLNAVYREVHGVNLPSNPNYSPLTVKPQQVAAGQMQDPVTGQAVGGAGYTPGSLRTRSQSAVAEPDFRSALQTYAAHVKQIEHWKAFAPAVAETRAILGKRDLMNRVEEKAGARISGALSKWLDRFQNGGTRDAAASLAMTKAMTRLMGRAASMALVGRVSVLMIQSTQLFASITQMPTGSFVKRFGMLLSGNLSWGQALKSPYIQRRLAQMPPAVQAAMDGLASSKPNLLKHSVRHIGQLISGTDALMTAGTFAIVYDYELTQAKKMNVADPESYAMERAELAVDRVAQPMKMSARSLMEVDTANPYMRLVWAFASDARQKMALLGFNGANMKGNKARFMRTFFLVWGVGGVLATALRTAWRDAKEDDDDEVFDEKNWNAKRFAMSAALGPFAGVPVLGDGLEAAAYKATGEYMPQGNMLTGIAESAASFKDITEIPDQDLGETLRDVESMLTALGGISENAAAASSIMHIARDAYAIADSLDGEKEPKPKRKRKEKE